MATGLNTLLGAVIGIAERVVYPSYQAARHLSAATALDDQALGGGIMWSATHMFLIAILVLLNQAMDAGERKTQRLAPMPGPPDSSG